MDWDADTGLSRIFDPQQATNMLAVDHATSWARLRAWRSPAIAIAARSVHRRAHGDAGLLRNTVDPAIVRSIVLRASGGPSIVGPALEDEAITTSVRTHCASTPRRHDAVFVGTPFERQSIANLALLVTRRADPSFPVLGSRPSGRSSPSGRALYQVGCPHLCRDRGRLREDLLHEGFEEVVRSAMVPVVIAGARKLETERDAAADGPDRSAAGAAGIGLRRKRLGSHPTR